MYDPACAALLPTLQSPTSKTLWIADENALPVVSSVMPHAHLRIVSNRYDVVQAAIAAGHAAGEALFGDFDFSAFADASIDCLIYRISKEKPVIHHVLNNAFRLLAPSGKLLLAGVKSDGIKTIISKTEKLFGNASAQKQGLAYVGCFQKNTAAFCADPLDTQEYTNLRLIHTPLLDFYSKPGLFGWNKIDKGSEFLMEYLPAFLAQYASPPQTMLDLGCGYGYLTLMTRHLTMQQRVATDNNAAALLAVENNAAFYQLPVAVIADDAAASIAERFDMILCNPPFHQGFSTDGGLSDKFLRNIRRLLAPQGRALVVVNSFIGIETKAAQYFAHQKKLASNASFKLIVLSAA
jgi:16S rRNA (guanine1207-N2)-methyltransferase